MSEDFINLVKGKLKFVNRERLVQYAIEKGYIHNSKVTAFVAADEILNNIDGDSAIELISRFSDKIGYSATELEAKLQITKLERQKWTRNNFLKVAGTYETRAYGQYLTCPIYDALQVMQLTEKDILEWRSAARQLTDRQKEGAIKARETALKNRTCPDCGSIQKNKLKNDVCYGCSRKRKAIERRRYWLDHKAEYVICDTETTGLGSKDQIVEIAIVDLDGNILLNTLIKPTVPISDEAYYVHGIDLKYLVTHNAPQWSDIYQEVKNILEKKVMLAYNADFDDNMIFQTCHANFLESIKTRYECIMQNVMQYYDSTRYISLQAASVSSAMQDHRALSDCLLCLDIIKKS